MLVWVFFVVFLTNSRILWICRTAVVFLIDVADPWRATELKMTQQMEREKKNQMNNECREVFACLGNTKANLSTLPLSVTSVPLNQSQWNWLKINIGQTAVAPLSRAFLQSVLFVVPCLLRVFQTHFVCLAALICLDSLFTVMPLTFIWLLVAIKKKKSVKCNTIGRLNLNTQNLPQWKCSTWEATYFSFFNWYLLLCLQTWSRVLLYFVNVLRRSGHEQRVWWLNFPPCVTQWWMTLLERETFEIAALKKERTERPSPHHPRV